MSYILFLRNFVIYMQLSDSHWRESQRFQDVCHCSTRLGDVQVYSCFYHVE